jgi:regulator of protease activity HflC (stomatin/prohibitin superfamily)
MVLFHKIMQIIFVFIIFSVVLGMLFFRIVNEYERAVVFRLGRIIGTRGPGLILVFPLIEKVSIVDLRTITLDVPTQDAITRDNVTVKISAVVYFKAKDPIQAILQVENYLLATSKLSQTTLRSVVGQVELDELLSNRDAVNHKIADILEAHTRSWGIEVANVEVKQIDLPAEMQRAMAKQAEAERERRSKIIAAEGELQASQKLFEAANVMEKNPTTLQLRYLQTLAEMATEKGTHTIVPIPIELFKSFLK